MPSLELNKLQGITARRALSESDRSQFEARGTTGTRSSDAAASKPGVAIEVGSTADTSTPPVNNERIAQIRKALEDGSYPLVPTEIADAMIAARVGFGVDAR